MVRLKQLNVTMYGDVQFALLLVLFLGAFLHCAHEVATTSARTERGVSGDRGSPGRLHCMLPQCRT